MQQVYTSKETSLSQVPALAKAKELATLRWAVNNPLILDYGCGKYDKTKEYVHNKLKCAYAGYDPYNRSAEENKIAMDTVRNWKGTVIVICANVLNVIDSDEEVKNVISKVSTITQFAFFSVYEGKGDGVGRATGKGWQRNERAANYSKFFKSAKRKGKIWLTLPEI
jgi:hypothetical protein